MSTCPISDILRHDVFVCSLWTNVTKMSLELVP